MPFLRSNRSIVLVLGFSLGCLVPRAASQSKVEGQEERIRRIEASVMNIPLGTPLPFSSATSRNIPNHRTSTTVSARPT